MDYAFSLALLETISVEEFLQLHGDEGYLIARNLIVCDECRGNVHLRKGEIKRAYFAHNKFKEENKGCTKRVGSYTPEYIKQQRRKHSKYRVGYFQQRFEDVLFLSLIEVLEKNGLPFADYYVSKKGFVLLSLNEENKRFAIDRLRDESKNHNASKLFNDFADFTRETIKNCTSTDDHWAMKRELEIIWTENNQYDVWKDLATENSNTSKIFAVEALRHLSSKGANVLVTSLLITAIHLYLSVELMRLLRLRSSNKDSIDKDLSELKNISIGKDFLVGFIDEELEPPLCKMKLIGCLQILDAIFRGKDKKRWKDVQQRFLSGNHITAKGEVVENIDDKNFGGYDYLTAFFHEMYADCLKVFSYTDIASIARRNYGDDRQSPDELVYSSTDKNRGFVYIAWAPYLKDIWKVELERLDCNDCIKIGYSEDPERRKTQIAGNIGPPDSIEIIDVWPAMDMKSAEKFIHSKLNKLRINPDRELFALSKEAAVVVVDELMVKYNKRQSKTSSGNGFG